MNDLRESAAIYVGPTPATETALARIASMGPGALTVMELLGLVLGKSTQDAHHFLGEFIDLSSLGRANVAELQRVYGVGPALAARVLAAFELGRRNMLNSEVRPRTNSPADAFHLLGAEMADLEQEQFRVIVLDTKNTVLGTPVIYKGSVNSTLVRAAEVFRAVLRHNAVACIMTHNHPSSSPEPSPEDVIVASKLRVAGEMINVEVLDFLIFWKSGFTSFKERGLGGFK